MASECIAVVDFVAHGEADDEWKMVLVEQGPWDGPIEAQLRRLQERLYGTIDAALDGQLAEKFSESLGKRIVVQLDGYNMPKAEVAEFFERFSKGVFQTAIINRH